MMMDLYQRKKTFMKSHILLVCVFCTFTLAFGQTTGKGRQAPNFTLEDIRGNRVELSSLVGKGPIIIDFWATWCKPCIEELNEMQRWIGEYADKNIIVLAISTDSEKSVAKVKPFVKTRNYPYTVLLDTNSDVARLYYAQNVPFVVLIDTRGKIVYTHAGYKKGDELELRTAIGELLAK